MIPEKKFTKIFIKDLNNNPYLFNNRKCEVEQIIVINSSLRVVFKVSVLVTESSGKFGKFLS